MKLLSIFLCGVLLLSCNQTLAMHCAEEIGLQYEFINAIRRITDRIHQQPYNHNPQAAFATIDALLRQHPNLINSVDHEGNNALHLALKVLKTNNHYIDLSMLLLRYNININQCNNLGQRPLSFVFKHDSQGLIGILLLIHGASRWVTNTIPLKLKYNTYTDYSERPAYPIYNEIANEQSQFFEQIREIAKNKKLGPTIQTFIQDYGKKINELVREWAKYNDLFKGYTYPSDAIPHLLNVCDKDGNTPLHWAVIYDNIELASYLLKNGANQNLPNNAGDTPLHTAHKYQQNTTAANILLEHGADPDVRDGKGSSYCDLTDYYKKKIYPVLLQHTTIAQDLIPIIVDYARPLNPPTQKEIESLSKQLSDEQATALAQQALRDAEGGDGYWFPFP